MPTLGGGRAEIAPRGVPIDQDAADPGFPVERDPVGRGRTVLSGPDQHKGLPRRRRGPAPSRAPRDAVEHGIGEFGRARRTDKPHLSAALLERSRIDAERRGGRRIKRGIRRFVSGEGEAGERREPGAGGEGEGDIPFEPYAIQRNRLVRRDVPDFDIPSILSNGSRKQF